MKKRTGFCLLLLISLLLAGCVSSRLPENATPADGKELIVNQDEQTIFDGQHTYSYDLSGNKDDYHVTITYPDGETYYESLSNGQGHSGWSNGYNEAAYTSGSKLVNCVIDLLPQPAKQSMALPGVLVLIIGLFSAIFPRGVWQLSIGWLFRNAEPSDAALTMSRVGGIVLVILGLVALFL